jgi:hypothetical protein
MITVGYPNNKIVKFKQFEDITNQEDIITIDCSFNQLTNLPDIMEMPNLKEFYCYGNKLIYLPTRMVLPNLKKFSCSGNNLTQLPTLMSMPNIRVFDCSRNKLTHLPDLMSMPNLKIFSCSHNQLTQLPLYIMNWTRLRLFFCSDNPLELSPQIARFINRIGNRRIEQINVYTDRQNVHNSNIQLCIKDSINALTTRSGIGPYIKQSLINVIIADPILTCKDQLIEYLDDESVHSLLLLTFGEVLWAVIRTIELDFDSKQQMEIKSILNQEMIDAECKCFTGRMGRVVNCLNGFSQLVNINIKDSDQIGNIIVLIKKQLTHNYDVETHKQLVKKELVSRGFDNQIIDEWIGYIE